MAVGADALACIGKGITETWFVPTIAELFVVSIFAGEGIDKTATAEGTIHASPCRVFW